MSYIDDFYSTPATDRVYLEQPCFVCSHLRYQHGQTKIIRTGSGWTREVKNTPGPCTGCRCRVFAEQNAITEGDVLDMHELLEHCDTAGHLFALVGPVV